eukprot:79469_1
MVSTMVRLVSALDREDKDNVIITIRLSDIRKSSMVLIAKRPIINRYIEDISKIPIWVTYNMHQYKIEEVKNIMNKEGVLNMILWSEISQEAVSRCIELVCIRNILYDEEIKMESIEEWESNQFPSLKCAVCGIKKSTCKLYKCCNCKLVKYCSRKCQKIDWKIDHYSICELVKENHNKNC